MIMVENFRYIIIIIIMVVHIGLVLHFHQEQQHKHQMMGKDISYSKQIIMGPPAPVVKNCFCVDCNEDKLCGGLWLGNRYPGMPSEEEVVRVKTHIVVSHCKKSLDWMAEYLEGFTNIASIHVISKCGQEVKGAPNEAITVMLPNVGR